MRYREIVEGGWSSTVTQNTVITPAVVAAAMKIMQVFVKDFNNFLSQKNIAPVQLGYPTGSTAHYEVDPEHKIYGDIDLQIVVPEIDMPVAAQTYWTKLADEFVRSERPSYVHPGSTPGHPIIKLGDNAYVQVDLMPHPQALAHWGRYRVTPERGVKGLLHGNMFSTLGELLNMSIQHAGVQFKERDGVRQPYATTRKNYQLRTISTDIENFVLDIFRHEYQQSTGGDPNRASIDPLLRKNPGSNPRDIKIANLVAAVKGLARSFEQNNMFGTGNLRAYQSADQFLDQFFKHYQAKAMANVNDAKRDKAATPEAQARAADDRAKILQGLHMVQALFDS